MTFVEAVNDLIGKARARQEASERGEAKREYALSVTALEEAQMRFTRGRAIDTENFEPADLEKVIEGDLSVDPTTGAVSVGGISLDATLSSLTGRKIRFVVGPA
jgi:hypothetical protein